MRWSDIDNRMVLSQLEKGVVLSQSANGVVLTQEESRMVLSQLGLQCGDRTHRDGLTPMRYKSAFRPKATERV